MKRMLFETFKDVAVAMLLSHLAWGWFTWVVYHDMSFFMDMTSWARHGLVITSISMSLIARHYHLNKEDPLGDLRSSAMWALFITFVLLVLISKELQTDWVEYVVPRIGLVAMLAINFAIIYEGKYIVKKPLPVTNTELLRFSLAFLIPALYALNKVYVNGLIRPRGCVSILVGVVLLSLVPFFLYDQKERVVKK